MHFHRLKQVLSDLISPVQSSFVLGRQITDNVMVMQEILHSMRRKTAAKGWMAIKLDWEKAYDRLRWEFIHDTRTNIKLPNYLIEVTMNYVSSWSLNILWNCEPIESFKPSRGIPQGVPSFAILICGLYGEVVTTHWSQLQCRKLEGNPSEQRGSTNLSSYVCGWRASFWWSQQGSNENYTSLAGLRA